MKLKRIIDLIMTILLIILMGYHITGNKIHEILGVITLILFIIHNILNIKWYKNVFKGKFNVQRFIFTTIDIMLIIISLIILISSISISGYVFEFFNLTTTMFARNLHLISVSWLFILISLHIGLHISGFLNKLTIKMKNTMFEYVYYFIILILIILGIYFIFDLGLYKDLIGMTKFKFFDFEQNKLIFYFKYLSIMFSNILIIYVIKYFRIGGKNNG